MSNKAALALAAIELMAEDKVTPSDLAGYLSHTSQHSEDFRREINEHKGNILAFEDFATNSRAKTAPHGVSTTYSQAQLDKMVSAAVVKAVADRDKDAGALKMTQEQLSAMVAEKVAEALAVSASSGKKQKGGD